jgi:hypothetical protein
VKLTGEKVKDVPEFFDTVADDPSLTDITFSEKDIEDACASPAAGMMVSRLLC